MSVTLPVSVDTGATISGTTFESIRQGTTFLSISNLRASIDTRFSNIQTMFDALPRLYAETNHTHKASDIASGTLDLDSIPDLPTSKIPDLPASKITYGTLTRPLTITDGLVQVKESAVDLDAPIDHQKQTYFGIDSTVERHTYTYRDNNGAIVSCFHHSLDPDGTISVYITNNNPQPGTSNQLSSSIKLTTNKSGKATFSWKGLNLTYTDDQETIIWKNFKLAASGSRITSHSISPAFIGIQSGTAPISVEASGTQEIIVVFGTNVTSYTKVPIVTVTPLVSSAYVSNITTAITSITKTQAKVIVKNSNSSNTVTGTLQWASFPADGDSLVFT